MKNLLLILLIPTIALGIGGTNTKFGTQVMEFLQITTPTTPVPTKNKLYFKNDDELYMINSSGSENKISSPSPSFVTVTKTTTATLATTNEDNVVVDATTTSFTVTLPTAIGNSGLTYKITKSTASNVVTIDGNASETIGGTTTVDLVSLNDNIVITSNGANWLYLSNDIAERCETKYLSADITADTVNVSNLAVSGLVTGLSYKVCMHLLVQFNLSAVDNVSLVANHNSTVIGSITASASKTTTTPEANSVYACTPTFTAAASTVTFDVGSLSSGNTVRGNGAIDETHIEICTSNKKTTTEF